MAISVDSVDTPWPCTKNAEWLRSDQYHNSFLHRKDDVLDSVLKNCEDHGLPEIAVSPSEGKLYHLIALSVGAKRILEVGTLGGYSTIWLARALPNDGELITAELCPEYAEVARENIAKAGLSSKVRVIVGPAADTLASMSSDPPFDLVFIDADKPSNSIYFQEAKRLVRKGGVIIVDNVVRCGQVANPAFPDDHDHVEGVRRLLNLIKSDNDIEATTIGTAGEKGYDGFLYAVRR